MSVKTNTLHEESDSSSSFETPSDEYVIDDVVNATYDHANSDLMYYVLWRAPKDMEKAKVAGDLQSWEPAEHLKEVFGRLAVQIKDLKKLVQDQMAEYGPNTKKRRKSVTGVPEPGFKILAKPWNCHPEVEQQFFFRQGVNVPTVILEGGTCSYKKSTNEETATRSQSAGGLQKLTSSETKPKLNASDIISEITKLSSVPSVSEKRRKLDVGSVAKSSPQVTVPRPAEQISDTPSRNAEANMAVRHSAPFPPVEAIVRESVDTVNNAVLSHEGNDITWDKLRTGITNGIYYVASMKVPPNQDISSARVKFKDKRTGKTVCSPTLAEAEANVTGQCALCAFYKKRVAPTGPKLNT